MSDDLISRQVAIELMLAALDDDWEPDYAKDRMCELPSAQPEITEEQVKEYCEKRCLVVLSTDAFYRLKSGHPERCEDCGNFNKTRLVIPQPERKKGKWIKKMRVTETEKYISCDPEWYCDCCGTKYDSHIAKIVNFCYVCGADMRGGKSK